MSGRSGWGGWPPQPIPGTARPGALPTKGVGDPARDTIDTAETVRGGADDTPWRPPTPPPAAPKASPPAH